MAPDVTVVTVVNVDAAVSDEIRAAGGVIVRPSGNGVTLALVHRPRYDDWSLPKGKAEAGETDEQTAVREVEEETGLRCRLVRPVGDIRYTDNRGRPKLVRYWLMEPEDPAAVGHIPDDEVDELRWCTPDVANDLLSYDHDRDIVQAALGAVR